MSVDDAAIFIEQWQTVVAEPLETSQDIVSSLAALSAFTRPANYPEYKDRFERLPPGVVRTVPEDIQRFARVAGYEQLVRGHLFRGLPLVAANGHALLSQQRRLAADLVRALPYIDNVSEVDSLGRLVFCEPYSRQLESRYFDIGTFDWFKEVRRRPGQWIAHTSLDAAPRRLLSFASPILRDQKIDGYLIVSIAFSEFISIAKRRIILPSQIIAVSTKEVAGGSQLTRIRLRGTTGREKAWHCRVS